MLCVGLSRNFQLMSIKEYIQPAHSQENSIEQPNPQPP